MVSRLDRTVAVVALALMLVASCGDGGDDPLTAQPIAIDEPTATAVPPDPTPTGSTAPTPAPPGDDSRVTPIPDLDIDDPDARPVAVFWVRNGELAVGGRIVSATTPARAALERLLAAPTEREADLGLETAIPSGVRLLDLRIAGETATVDLSAEVESGGLGTSGEQALVAQIVFTLTQFPTVDDVTITIDGESRDAILGHGLDPVGLTRADFADAVAPEIVIESPLPFAVVPNQLTVRGVSRTFEATVVYEITDAITGDMLAAGFTTAAQPDVDRRGPFEFTATVPSAFAGSAIVSVFEESAADGSRINGYDVPVEIDPGRSIAWLRVNGFGPLDFGTAQSDAITVVSERFGGPMEVNDLGECPAGPATIAGWDDFSLLMSEGRFAGWFYRSSTPVLTTPSAVTTGISRSQIIDTYVGVDIFDSTLGEEFFFEVPAGFIGGFFDEDGQTVTELFAGTTCFFR